MGITISKTASLAPISLASTIIGFISFAVTLMTWFGIFFSDMRTIASAPNEIPDFLGNLKQGLYEERAHLRRVHKQLKRRRGSSVSRHRHANEDVGEKERRHGRRVHEDTSEDAVSNKALRDALRHMIRSFREIERPFLEDDDPRSGQHGRSTRDQQGWDTEGWGYGYGADEEEDLDYSRTVYRDCGLRERYMWLKKKGDVMSLLAGLARIETRRIAKETGDLLWIMKGLERRIDGIEQRLSRVIGVRRID